MTNMLTRDMIEAQFESKVKLKAFVTLNLFQGLFISRNRGPFRTMDPETSSG